MKLLSWIAASFVLGGAYVSAQTSNSFLSQGLPAPETRFLTQNDGILPDRPLSDEEYILGPGDLFNIPLGGNPGFKVDPQGMLALPGVAPIKVSGMTLAEGKKALKRNLARAYDTSKVYITLGGPNVFRVSLQGEVSQPGHKATNSFTRVMELIQSSGGFTRFSIRDTVTIIGYDGQVRHASLHDAFNRGEYEKNLLLRFGDEVRVGRVDFNKPYCIVKYEGRTYYHQINDRSSLANIQFEVANFSRGLGTAGAKVTSPGNPPRHVPPDEMFGWSPNPGDTVDFVQENQNVYVGGAVMRPGALPYTGNLSASDYTFLAGLSSESSSDNDIRIVRNGKSIPLDAHGQQVRPGDQIYVKRDGVYMTRDYLAIAASLASIIISSVTLYITASQ